MFGQVVIADGIGDFRIFAVAQGVVAPGDTLHLVELQHHLRDQIRLAQFAGAGGLVGVTANFPGDMPGQAADAFDFFVKRTQLFLEHDGAEFLHPLCQRHLLVGFEKESGVAQARADHPFVAADDLGRVLAVDIGDGDKMRQQAAIPVGDVKIFLVFLHGQDQRFRGHGQEPFLEGAGQRHRPFHQCGDLVQQVVVDHRDAPHLLALGDDLFADHGPAFGKIRDNMAAPF